MESLATLAILVAAAAAASGAAAAVIRKKFPRAPFSYACDGYELTLHGRHRDAIRLYDKSIARFKKAEAELPRYMEGGGYRRYGVTHAWKAISLARLGRADDALDSSERAIELDSSNTRVCLARATVLYAAGMSPELLKLANARLEADASDVNMHLYRAVALLGLGEDEQAIASISKALELAPDSETIRRLLGHVERDSRLRDTDEAEARRWLTYDADWIDEVAQVAWRFRS